MPFKKYLPSSFCLKPAKECASDRCDLKSSLYGRTAQQPTTELHKSLTSEDLKFVNFLLEIMKDAVAGFQVLPRDLARLDLQWLMFEDWLFDSVKLHKVLRSYDSVNVSNAYIMTREELERISTLDHDGFRHLFVRLAIVTYRLMRQLQPGHQPIFYNLPYVNATKHQYHCTVLAYPALRNWLGMDVSFLFLRNLMSFHPYHLDSEALRFSFAIRRFFTEDELQYLCSVIELDPDRPVTTRVYDREAVRYVYVPTVEYPSRRMGYFAAKGWEVSRHSDEYREWVGKQFGFDLEASYISSGTISPTKTQSIEVVRAKKQQEVLEAIPTPANKIFVPRTIQVSFKELAEIKENIGGGTPDENILVMLEWLSVPHTEFLPELCGLSPQQFIEIIRNDEQLASRMVDIYQMVRSWNQVDP